MKGVKDAMDKINTEFEDEKKGERALLTMVVITGINADTFKLKPSCRNTFTLSADSQTGY